VLRSVAKKHLPLRKSNGVSFSKKLITFNQHPKGNLHYGSHRTNDRVIQSRSENRKDLRGLNGQR